MTSYLRYSINEALADKAQKAFEQLQEAAVNAIKIGTIMDVNLTAYAIVLALSELPLRRKVILSPVGFDPDYFKVIEQLDSSIDSFAKTFFGAAHHTHLEIKDKMLVRTYNELEAKGEILNVLQQKIKKTLKKDEAKIRLYEANGVVTQIDTLTSFIGLFKGYVVQLLKLKKIKAIGTINYLKALSKKFDGNMIDIFCPVMPESGFFFYGENGVDYSKQVADQSIGPLIDLMLSKNLAIWEMEYEDIVKVLNISEVQWYKYMIKYYIYSRYILRYNPKSEVASDKINRKAIQVFDIMEREGLFDRIIELDKTEPLQYAIEIAIGKFLNKSLSDKNVHSKGNREKVNAFFKI